MNLIDSHCHLTYAELSELEAVLARAAEAGVERIISVATDLADAAAALSLARKYPDVVRVAAGIHPHGAGKVSDADLEELARLWRDEPVVAFGEMGLDYHYDFAERSVQKHVFAEQLRRALPLDRPIIIHSREALDDTIAILIDEGYSGRRVVFHCFGGGPAEADLIGAHGWRVSFTGTVTFRKSKETQEVARTYPADRLMVETDAPYLSPEPVRGRKPNEPSFLAYTARFLAELRGESLEALAEQMTANTQTFFGLA